MTHAVRCLLSLLACCRVTLSFLLRNQREKGGPSTTFALLHAYTKPWHLLCAYSAAGWPWWEKAHRDDGLHRHSSESDRGITILSGDPAAWPSRQPRAPRSAGGVLALCGLLCPPWACARLQRAQFVPAPARRAHARQGANTRRRRAPARSARPRRRPPHPFPAPASPSHPSPRRGRS